MVIDADYYRELLRQRFEGRRAIIAYGYATVTGKDVALLRELGCVDPFVLCEGMGPGTAEPDFSYRVIGIESADNVMTALRGYERNVRNLPDEVVEALREYDPDGSALVFRPIWGTFDEVAGRAVYGARKPAWMALEDKVVIDELWDHWGVMRAPCKVVSADSAALRTAHRELDRGLGTVWAADARDGWHGGGEGTHWVVNERHAERAVAALTGHCDRVRVMPFLEGTPCSIHGVVTRDRVIALRPVEMVMLRDMENARMSYHGAATTWDPPAEDREEMRAIARRVGQGLREAVDFRGTFTIDGIMSADGFRPTELNPRYGAGMFRITAGCPELPMMFIDAAICADEDWDFRLDELEELLVSTSDAHRLAMCIATAPDPRSESETIALIEDAGGLRRAADGEDPIGEIAIGPSNLGSFLRIRFEPSWVEPGQPTAPRIAEALAFCDRELGTSFGQLASARSVR